MNTIKPNTTISATLICDSNIKINAYVIERKGDFVTLKVDGEKNIIRKKVKKGFDGSEYVLALGSYSMAPMFY
jgi:hypothetical protein